MHGWGRLLLAAAMVFAATSVWAQSNDPLVVRREAASWLNRIHTAARQQSYEGTFVYQRGSMVQSSRITHYAERGGGEFEEIESLDGKLIKMLRHNDDVYTFIPGRKLCVVEKRQNKDSFPALLSASVDDVLSVYEPEMLGIDRVAGIDSQVIELHPKDHYRFAYKLWADQKTGLLLRAQTLDDTGRILEQIAFSQVRVGVPADKNMIAAGIRNTANWHIVRPPLQPVDMEAEGWRLEPGVPGFRKIRELRRLMAARDPDHPPIKVDQVVFSDGLSAISVFVEPVNKSDRKEGVASSGATHILLKRSGDFWITLLGEVPLATLEQVASAIKYKTSK